jgi:hypothetical protein
MKLKIFFCQFPNSWTLRVSGMGGYTSKCEKKSKSLHPIMQADASTVGDRSVTGEKSTTDNNQTSEILKKEFLKKLITSFEDLVVNFLDKSARDAIKQQQEITDEKEFCQIKLAIENRVLKILIDDSSILSVPVVGFFR